MRVRAALKAATADLHDELDGRMGSLDLAAAAQPALSSGSDSKPSGPPAPACL